MPLRRAVRAKRSLSSDDEAMRARQKDSLCTKTYG